MDTKEAKNAPATEATATTGYLIPPAPGMPITPARIHRDLNPIVDVWMHTGTTAP